MLKLDTKGELEALHNNNVKESLHLEYKASDAIDKKDDRKKLEMARDVSAFANADGGQVVYGMMEKDHEPAGLDQGIDAKTYPEIWFEQVLWAGPHRRCGPGFADWCDSTRTEDGSRIGCRARSLGSGFTNCGRWSDTTVGIISTD